MSTIHKKIFIICLAFFPVFSFAQTTNAANLLERVLNIVIALIPIAFALAVVAFFFGIARYVFSVGKGKDDGKEIMTWGVIAIFVMVSVFGLTTFIRSSIGIGEDAPLRTPSVRDNLSI